MRFGALVAGQAELVEPAAGRRPSRRIGRVRAVSRDPVARPGRSSRVLGSCAGQQRGDQRAGGEAAGERDQRRFVDALAGAAPAPLTRSRALS